MMDSQENTLEQGKMEVENVEEITGNAAEIAEDVTSQVENQAEQAVEEVVADAEQSIEETAPASDDATEETAVKAAPRVYKTKAEILERVREIAHNEEENLDKGEIDQLKTLFYKLHIAEREAQQKEYLDAGGDPEAYQVVPDEEEEAFKAEMNVIKEKRAKIFQAQESEKQDNLKRKLEIIEKIKSMATSPDEANKSFQQFKELQQQWREIKAVPAERAN